MQGGRLLLCCQLGWQPMPFSSDWWIMDVMEEVERTWETFPGLSSRHVKCSANKKAYWLATGRNYNLHAFGLWHRSLYSPLEAHSGLWFPFFCTFFLIALGPLYLLAQASQYISFILSLLLLIQLFTIRKKEASSSTY